MKVAVIGASGAMGSFFVRYFRERGDAVSGSDSNARRRSGGGVELQASNAKAVEGCDLAILAVPMDRTIDVAEEVVPVMKNGSVLVEMSSVKGDALDALKKVVAGRVRLLSIHPLFGPALASTKGMKIAVIAGRNGRGADVEEARRLFPEARIIPIGRREHDKAMAVVLSLTHLVNIAYAGAAAKFLTPGEFMKVSTPNSSMQLTLAEAVLTQDPGLSFAIQAKNPYTMKVAREAARQLRKILEAVEESDWKGFEENFSKLATRYRTDARSAAVVREVYSAAEKLA